MNLTKICLLNIKIRIGANKYYTAFNAYAFGPTDETKTLKEALADDLDALYFEKIRLTFTRSGISRIIQSAPAGSRAKDVAIEKLAEKCLRQLSKANTLEEVLRVCKKQHEIGCTKIQTQIWEKALMYAKNFDEDLIVLSICPNDGTRLDTCKRAIDDSVYPKQISYICKLDILNPKSRQLITDYAMVKWEKLSTSELAEVKTSDQAIEALRNAPDDSDIQDEISYNLIRLKIKEGKITCSNIQFKHFFETVD